VINIYVDADASPIKNEAIRVAQRYGLKVYFVANSNSKLKRPDYKLAEIVLVKDELDAADDWIAERVTENDVAISADVPLAARCVKKGARVLDPRGRVFTEESIGEALSHRDIMTFLRDTGNRDAISRSPAYDKKDRSRFLQRLDELIQSIVRQQQNNGAGAGPER
jgi:uncharacterized protein YaiI (UPF0178 family)